MLWEAALVERHQPEPHQRLHPASWGERKQAGVLRQLRMAAKACRAAELDIDLPALYALHLLAGLHAP